MSTQRGIESVLAKLKASVEQGDYYAAQQMYKTLHFRYSTKKQYDDLVKLLTQGAVLMLQHGQVSEGSELALLLLQHYKDQSVAPSKEALDNLINIFICYPDDADALLRRSFVKAAVAWTSSPSNNDQGDPALHDVFAAFYDRTNEFAFAEKHYLRGGSGGVSKFAQMLNRWSSLGYGNEKDLFIARSVFQYLCLSNIKDARLLFSEFQNLSPIDSPLMNFTRYLLEVVQHSAFPLFSKLRSAYAASLNRDPLFAKYMDLIAKIFYHVEPPNKGGMSGILGGLMRSFIGGDL